MKESDFDVIVVGSGPTGGFAAYELARAGVNVLLLEAGTKVDLSQLDTHAYPYELPDRRRPSPFYDKSIGDVVYKTTDNVAVDRIRTLGGRSMHWNAVCLRFSKDDFRENTVNDIEVDWPLSYNELVPFYEYVERTVGIVGTRENLEVVPDSVYWGKPPAFRCAEVLAARACEKLKIRMIPTRKAISTKVRGTRGACHYCGHCMSGCHSQSIFNTTNALFPAAESSGRLRLRTNALARAVILNEKGRAAGVSIIDRVTGKEEELHAKAVVLACGGIETPRLLLNSVSPQSPNGVGNDNGLVGRWLCGHSKADFFGYLEALSDAPMTNNDGALDHSIIPRFARQTKGYKGGFQIQTQFARYDFPHHAPAVPGFGAQWKAKVRSLAPAMLQMGSFGKVMARFENFVSVDKDRTDPFGIPLPTVQFSFCDEDRALFADMMAVTREIHEMAGAKLMFGGNRIGGFASHETGTCRMGDDPKTSVVNRWGQVHNVPNLVVADGSTFPTFPEKNPTLTLMALSVRAARHLLAQSRRRAL